MCGTSRDINEASVPALFEAKGIMVGVVLFADNESDVNTTEFQVNYATGETLERPKILQSTMGVENAYCKR